MDIQTSSFSNLSSYNAKYIKDPKKLSNPNNESILNFKLTLRKKKIQSIFMDMRLKKNTSNDNNYNKISTKKKLYEFKKLFEPEKIKDAINKLLLINNNNIKDIKIIELIHLYSQHLNSNENVKNIFETNIEKLINIFLKEIILDVNSTSINFELFDYYLIIIGNFFIYKKNIYDNKDKEYLNLFLNILNKNTFLEIYTEHNYNIINDTLWLIYLYIYYDSTNYIYLYNNIIKSINNLFNNEFFIELNNFYINKKKENIYLSIVKEIIYSCLSIYTSLLENIVDINKNEKNIINISKEDYQLCLDIMIKILNFDLIKDIYNENITNIISLLLSINKDSYKLNLNNFNDIFISLFNKYKNYEYDNIEISQNIIIILYYLIINYYDDSAFINMLNTSDIIPLCIQYYLKNGSIINITLYTLNMLFKYPLEYNKIIIKSINYQLLDIVCEILSNTEINSKNCYGCLNILINAYFFLENNMKNPHYDNINKYFNMNLISKLEQLILSDNKDIEEMASILYKKMKNFDN